MLVNVLFSKRTQNSRRLIFIAPVDKITQHENQNLKATNGFNLVIMNSP